MSENENITDIEDQLCNLLSEDKKSWTSVYTLMSSVEADHLYTSAGYKSYTQWVNAMAARAGVHVSYLWKQLKAGKYYTAYQSSAEARGISIPSIDSSDVSPDTLDLIEKISSSNTEVADQLMQRAINHDIGRKDLKAAWQTVKADRENQGLQPTRKTRHDRKNFAFAPDMSPAEDKSADSTKISAEQIVLTLAHRSNWLDCLSPADNCDNYDNSSHLARKYRLLTEVAVRSGDTRNARRLDALIIETMRARTADELTIHGIEIKISRSDLLGDHKMAEYTDFVDYFWLAVPSDLVADAESIKLPEWGILSVEESDVQVVSPATKLHSVMREKTLAQACFALM